MVFDVAGEPAGLQSQAFQPQYRERGRRAGRQEKLDPVDQPKRHGKGLPGIRPALRVGRYPALDQFRPVGAPRLVQIIEIVQIVAPELAEVHARPIETGGIKALALTDESEGPWLAAAVARQWRVQVQTGTRHKAVRDRCANLRPQPADELKGCLARFQVGDGAQETQVAFEHARFSTGAAPVPASPG